MINNALLSATVDGGLPPPPTGYFAAVLTPEPSDQGWLVYVGYGKDLMGSLNPAKNYTEVYATSGSTSPAECRINMSSGGAGELRLLNGKSYTSTSNQEDAKELFNYFFGRRGKPTLVFLRN